jgi:hypothetical protein
VLALARLPLDRWVTGSSSLGLGFLWGGNGAYLLHQAQGVPVLPLLDDLALFDTMNSDPTEGRRRLLKNPPAPASEPLLSLYDSIYFTAVTVSRGTASADGVQNSTVPTFAAS